jgi:uncharacterized DUF497 family protein
VATLSWDARKRAANLHKHGFDFVDAFLALEGDHVIFPTHPGSDEARFIAVGRIGPHYVTLVFTERGDTIRVISLRKARHGERQQHQALYG